MSHPKSQASVFGTGGCRVETTCQVCGGEELETILFLGYLPPVNTMPKIGTRPAEQSSYPAELLWCQNCQLVQLGLVVDPQILFPKEYPYTSGTTKILRENFADLQKECAELLKLGEDDLVVDVGSNDGTLLSNFQPHNKVQGITPEDVGQLARDKGIPTLQSYFSLDAAKQVVAERGKASLVTATNVFAHIDNVHEVLDAIMEMLGDEGTFVSESHYLVPLLETCQYDTIYHEHLRYYSLHALKHLLESHGLEVYHAHDIPTHGGSIRVFASRKGVHPVQASVEKILKHERETIQTRESFEEFKKQVVLSKLELHALLLQLKKDGARIHGIGAPSRASTLIAPL